MFMEARKAFKFPFPVASAGDPEALEECDEANITGLSWGRNPGEAWQKLLDYCEDLVRRNYWENQVRRRIVENFRAAKARGGNPDKPQLFKWGVVIPRASAYRAVAEISLEDVEREPADVRVPFPDTVPAMANVS